MSPPHHTPHNPTRRHTPTPSHTRPHTAPPATFPDHHARHAPGLTRAAMSVVESGPIQRGPLPPLPVFGASRAPAGAVVFHRYLEDLNRTPHATLKPAVHREPDRFDPSCPKADAATDHPGPGLLPRLGEVTPVEPEPRTRVVVDIRHRVIAPATGRVLDLLA
ncbi:MAG: hypothetical protein LAT64_08875 [Phycisphaerales bacterium]|nr:hypothetical protein [Planctomycetota bacterium]MCH8508863.1 hypothetical protein [Phycisphaerales bacterium]